MEWIIADTLSASLLLVVIPVRAMLIPFILVYMIGTSIRLTSSSLLTKSIPLKTVSPVSVRYLETNAWVINLGQFEIAIDPVLYAPLDFGIPLLYSGQKRFIDGKRELNEISQSADYVLLSQGLDDHAHRPTLTKLSTMRPTMPYIAPPSAVAVLKSCGIDNRYISAIAPGQKIKLEKAGDVLEISATTGALVGPPWQANENGYILRLYSSSLLGTKSCSIYYEPHCMYDPAELARLAPVDYVITPIVSQQLPFFTLVDGGPKALRLVEILKAKAVIPMANGELEQTGLLSSVIRSEGSESEFKSMAKNLKVFDVTPGVSVPLAVR